MHLFLSSKQAAATFKSHSHTFKNFKLNLVTQLARRATTSADPSTSLPTPSEKGRRCSTGPLERFTENKHLIIEQMRTEDVNTAAHQINQEERHLSVKAVRTVSIFTL
ncbi:hypothetical protein PoB_000811700 [Plakobranchus ocellatus]|uniref:Uncharacterized protein n=1 Tax=Plakobranchus ocellatus TaxID=259542 RepID=A0AAV3YGP6_9GAST|nr:hypothetical protein PoB_000811700 [Plakobranchus ocellatus]